ncbi:MAG: hypothetical protein L6R19_10985 [Alphaproteobacteria bacterium]|nr:hypothetical protein [Alphaproteobacteria bacterium]
MARLETSWRKWLPRLGIALWVFLVAAGAPSMPDRAPDAGHRFELAAADQHDPTTPCNTGGGHGDHSRCVASHGAPGAAVIGVMAPFAAYVRQEPCADPAPPLQGHATPPLFHPPKAIAHA